MCVIKYFQAGKVEGGEGGKGGLQRGGLGWKGEFARERGEGGRGLERAVKGKAAERGQGGKEVDWAEKGSWGGKGEGGAGKGKWGG